MVDPNGLYTDPHLQRANPDGTTSIGDPFGQAQKFSMGFLGTDSYGPQAAYDPATGKKLKSGNANRSTPKFSAPTYDGPQYTPSYHPMLDHNYNNAVRNAAVGAATITALILLKLTGHLYYLPYNP